MIRRISLPLARPSKLSSLSRLWAVAWNCGQRFELPMYRHYATGSPGPLVSATQLQEAINSTAALIILDCTWYMPNVPRNAVAEFQKARIPGARFFNLDEVTDKSSPYPHMLPSANDFADAVGLSLRCAFS